MDGAVSLWERYGTHRYNSRSSGFTTTISNLLLLFHSCILLVYQNYCKRLCTLKRLVYLNIVLEKCSRWKFAAHDEQQYDDHQGKVAFWFGVLSIPPQVQGILIAPCRPSTGAVIEQHARIERILPVCGKIQVTNGRRVWSSKFCLHLQQHISTSVHQWRSSYTRV